MQPRSIGSPEPSASGSARRFRISIRSAEESSAQRARALRHALSEYEIKVHTVLPGQALGGGAGRMKARCGPRSRSRPEEGWISLLLVALMAMTVGWSIDDAAWVLGNGRLTDFLPLATCSASSPVSSARRWAGTAGRAPHRRGVRRADRADPRRPGPCPGRATSGAVRGDRDGDGQRVVGPGRPSPLATRQTGHHLLVIGLLCWATGQFAASAVFRHRRPLSAVVVIGTILIANMGATVRGQLGYMIIFSVAALFLLIRLHALDEQATWTRRRIGDPAAVSSIYLRGGTVFIVIAVSGRSR